MTDVQAHSCPGCGAPGINPNRLACPSCWHRLPARLRAAVIVSWRRVNTRPDSHRRAVAAALAWYADNPRTPP